MTASLAKSNSILQPRTTYKVTCGLTACTPELAPAQRSVTSMGELYLVKFDIALNRPMGKQTRWECMVLRRKRLTACQWWSLRASAVVLRVHLQVCVLVSAPKTACSRATHIIPEKTKFDTLKTRNYFAKVVQRHYVDEVGKWIILCCILSPYTLCQIL